MKVSSSTAQALLRASPRRSTGSSRSLSTPRPRSTASVPPPSAADAIPCRIGFRSGLLLIILMLVLLMLMLLMLLMLMLLAANAVHATLGSCRIGSVGVVLIGSVRSGSQPLRPRHGFAGDKGGSAAARLLCDLDAGAKL